MYTLKFNSYPIYDPRVEDLSVREPSFHLAVGEPGNASFVIDSDHPFVGQLTKLKGVLELLEDDVPIFRGRITKDSMDFYKSREVEAEGLLACLNDSVVAPFVFPDDFQNLTAYKSAASSGNVVEYFLSWLLSQHNAQVTTEQQILLGNVTVTDQNNYVARSASDYATTWDTIQDKLVGSTLGGHLLIRYEADGNYLDYVEELPLTNVQTVAFAENLIDLVSEVNAAELFTVILPIGAEGLTIRALSDGPIDSDLVKDGDSIYSTAGVATYGRIARVAKWDDVTIDTNLRAKAAAALGSAGYAQTITVQACDLHGLYGTASLRVGRMTRLVSPPHEFSALYPLLELDPDILDPGNTQVTLGRTVTTQTDYNRQRERKAAEKADVQQMEINQINRDLASTVTTLTEQITSAVQNSQSIVFEALERYVLTGDLESYREQVSSRFEQTAGSIQMTFSQLSELIGEVNGDLQSKYNERISYIRFEDGNIILGREGNEITLVESNDRISFMQSGQEVAWFSNNQFHVTEAEFTTRARIGTFAFVPGENGNLSFKKVN